MKRLIMAALIATTAGVPLAANAQTSHRTAEAQREYDKQQAQLNDAQRRGDRHDIRKQSKDVRQAQQNLAKSQKRDWRHGRNYGHNRSGNGGVYYADQHYRDGSQYQERRLADNDRVYRGRDGRYYCKRNDGTTGLIVGGVAGGLLGNVIANGHSSTLATLLGAGGGALVGRSIDRNSGHDGVRCR